MISPISFLKSENYRTYRIDLAKYFDSVTAAILFDELLNRQDYHIERGELASHERYGGGWFYSTIESMTERTYLSRKEQDSALKILKKFKIIEMVTFGIPPRRYFKFNYDSVLAIYNKKFVDQEEKKDDSSVCAKCRGNLCPDNNFKGQKKELKKRLLNCPKRTNHSVRKGQIAHIYKEQQEEQYNKTPPNPQKGEAAEAASVNGEVDPSVKKIAYGEQGNVLLTEKQHEALLKHMSNEERAYWIETIDLEVAKQGKTAFNKKYKCHYSTILSWRRMKMERNPSSQDFGKIAKHRQGSKLVTKGDYQDDNFKRERI